MASCVCGWRFRPGAELPCRGCAVGRKYSVIINYRGAFVCMEASKKYGIRNTVYIRATECQSLCDEKSSLRENGFFTRPEHDFQVYGLINSDGREGDFLSNEQRLIQAIDPRKS
jgi:hypothetical protein